MIRLKSYRQKRVSDQIAIAAAFMLSLSSVIGFLDRNQDVSQAVESGKAVIQSVTDESDNSADNAVNIVSLLFRHG